MMKPAHTIAARLAVGTSIATSLIAFLATPALADEGYYQYPSAHGDVLVIASEGDLWRTGRDGGTAIRLTSDPAEETDPKVSPDGTMVAFTASYDSDRDIYVMPVAGGAPRRLTFEGAAVRTVGWTPDGKVIFSSSLTGADQGEILYTVDPAAGPTGETGSGAATAIPLWRANDATFGADGQTLFFSRRGLTARARDNAVLYRGGGMAQLWRWRMGSADEAVQMLADFGAPIRFPMASGGRIYFISDKSGADAVWSVAEDGSDVRQVSPEMAFPVLQASLDGDTVYLQNGADIYAFSIRQATVHKLAISIVTDRQQTRPRTIANPLREMEAARLSPSGKSVAVTARGRVALAFPAQMRRVEFAVPLDARARQAVAGAKGDKVYMILDQGDRGEIVAMNADGSGTPQPLTHGYDAYIWSFAVAPDEKTIVLWDKQFRLQKLDLATGRVTLLARADNGDDAAFQNIVFSPAGDYIAYAQTGRANNANTSDIFVQNLSTGARVQATSGKYNDYAPAFAPDGAWLYFLSDRNFAPSPGNPWGDRNMGVAFPDRGELYALQLDPSARFRFREDNELTREAKDGEESDPADKTDPADSGKDGTKGKDKNGDRKDATPKPAPIVFEGLQGRLYKVPVDPGLSDTLVASKDFLYARKGDDIVSIAIAPDRAKAKVETFAAKAQGFALSADGKTALVVAGSEDKPTLTLVPAKAKMPDDDDELAQDKVRLDDWHLTIDPRAEWRQMFIDAWRMHRDFAYDPTMRGVDWNAVRARLEPFLARIGHRAELNAILGQMSSQLGILHSQIRPGDVPKDSENSAMAFLGARYSPVAGGLRIDSIFKAEADLVAWLPPLRRPGVDARAGDVIQRVDGRPVATLGELRLALASKAGQEVRLDLLRGTKPVSTVVEPMTLEGEQTASYHDFVEGKRLATQTLSKGRIGYIHLKAMGPDDIATFARDYFAQLDKDGLIIDVRNNNGGNIDSLVIATLMRRAWAFWSRPDGSGVPTTNMQNAYRGHVAVLIDERTYSDGETFAAGIKSLGLAPLVGERTAGAGVWLSDRNRLTDSGQARVAENAQYAIDGTWIVEGRGIAPDIAVENPPHAAFEGHDAQLQTAIDLLDKQIAQEPAAPLEPQPLHPLGTPASDVHPLPARQGA
ncbi:S41 family peptidase [Novosphingobium sp. 1949]|uniref:Tricorn protease homolog n=1 Tax=Novosphingobium organovorum TaxID=2930092 RepID=A0ABT0BC05_9SPHN|nr:S41 family peptidase [Novosphingobium organovorum]MCJ2182552.1 S41 family peptidase [Novosphingobium organovorum]